MADLRATQSDTSSHSRVPSLGHAESPNPFLGSLGLYQTPDPWDSGHPPLRCRGSLRSQTCWSPPAVAVPPPDGSACIRPCREPARHPGWTSALASQAGALPRLPALSSPYSGRESPSSSRSPGARHRGGEYLTNPCLLNLFEHSILDSLILPREHISKPWRVCLQNTACPKSEHVSPLPLLS